MKIWKHEVKHFLITLMVSFRVFQGSMGHGKEDVISGAIELSEYLNRVFRVVVELNSCC